MGIMIIIIVIPKIVAEAAISPMFPVDILVSNLNQITALFLFSVTVTNCMWINVISVVLIVA